MAKSRSEDEGFEEKPRPRIPPRSAGQADEAFEENGQPAQRTRPPRRRDDDEDHPRRRSRRDDRDEGGALETLIPYHNGMALAAYYCGVFGLIPGLGAVLGPLSIIFGIVGLRKVSRNPRARGTGHAITGIVLGSLEALIHLVVVIAIVMGIFSHRR